MWNRRKWGVALGDEDNNRLTKLRFADDLILVAATKRQLVAMIRSLAESVGKVGLELHYGKTKVLTNQAWRHGESIQVGAQNVYIASSIEYLGRTLSFSSLHEAEIENRIARAWKRFMSLQRELCSKHYL